MEKIRMQVMIGINEYKEIDYPKYLYPNIKVDQNIVQANPLWKGSKMIFTYRLTTYYPVRSKEGNIHYIQIKEEYSTWLDEQQDIIVKEKKIEEFNKSFENKIIIFIHFNDYHEMSDEEINSLQKQLEYA